MDPLLLGLFLRGLGLVQVIAFAGVLPELTAYCGDRGVKPLADRLKRWDTDFCCGSWLRRFRLFPNFGWLLGTSDAALRAPVFAGIAAGVCLLLGICSQAAAVVACLCFVHCTLAMDLWFPWEALMGEVGFLSMFLPPALFIGTGLGADLSDPQAASVQLLPLTSFLLRTLAFRLLFGFGKIKFGSSTARDTTYLQSFFTNQPIPSPVGWFLRLLPVPLLQGMLAFMFLVEIPLPFLIFLGGWYRVATGLGFIQLMMGIQVCGNFGYFNFLTMVLSLTLLDGQASLFDLFSGGMPSVSALLVLAGLLVPYILAMLVSIPFNSWCNRSWYHWPKLSFAPWMSHRAATAGEKVANALLELYRFLGPFQWVSSYGVFPPQAVGPLRWVVTFEGSPTEEGDAEADWHLYKYRFQPTEETDAPCFVAPYHPRIDHSIYYSGLGHDSHDLDSALFMSEAYQWNRSTMIRRMAQRLLEGNQDVANSMFGGRNPFPTQAPVRVRCRLFVLKPTTPEERTKTGRWWTRKLVGDYLAPQSLPQIARDGDYFQQYVGSPLHTAELTHWDKFVWKRESPPFQRMLAPARSHLARWRASGEPLPSLRSLVEASPGLSAEDVDAFWRLVDRMPASVKHDWTGLRAYVDQVVKPAQRGGYSDKLDLVLWRYSYMLAEHFETAFWRGWEAISAQKAAMSKKGPVPDRWPLNGGPGIEKLFWPPAAHAQFEGKLEGSPDRLPDELYLPDHTHFHLCLTIHDALVRGEARAEELWQRPGLILEHVRELTWHRGAALLVAFYYDQHALQACGGRVVNVVKFGTFGEDLGGQMLIPGNQRLTKLLTSSPELYVEQPRRFYPHHTPPHPQTGWGLGVPMAEKLWRTDLDREAPADVVSGERLYE